MGCLCSCEAKGVGIEISGSSSSRSLQGSSSAMTRSSGSHSVMGALPSSSNTSTDLPGPTESMLSQLKQSEYRRVLTKRMDIDVYILRGNFWQDLCHDAVVLKAPKYGYVTMELSFDKDNRMVPLAKKYEDGIGKLNSKAGTLPKTTMQSLAIKAGLILADMRQEGYRLMNNNCQDFCNRFLKEVGLVDAQYVTVPHRLTLGIV